MSAEHLFSKWGDTVRKMPPLKRIEVIRQGVEVTLLVGASRYYGISQMRFSELLGISNASVTRKIRLGGRLGHVESERLVRIAQIQAEVEEVFAAPDLAKRWMLEPNSVLGEPPLSLLDTDTGTDEVRKVLAAIAYGGAV